MKAGISPWLCYWLVIVSVCSWRLLLILFLGSTLRESHWRHSVCIFCPSWCVKLQRLYRRFTTQISRRLRAYLLKYLGFARPTILPTLFPCFMLHCDFMLQLTSLPCVTGEAPAWLQLVFYTLLKGDQCMHLNPYICFFFFFSCFHSTH